MKKKHNLRVRPLSQVLLDARLANSSDRSKANELIMIYSLPSTQENVDKYFEETNEVSSEIFGDEDENYFSIESSLLIIARFFQWKEQYKELIYFKGSNDE